jgi:UPF0271 protein
MDLNADIGEADNPDWAKAEAQIMGTITSANIACGGHAGDETTMRETVRAAKAYNVVIGAHPAYPDRKNFGRYSLELGKDITEDALERALTEQIVTLCEIAAEEGMHVSYVKPHGALYNDAIRDKKKASLIVKVISGLDMKLALLGGPQSEMMQASQETGITFIAEGFIDRRYTDDGHLLSRKFEGAVLATDEERIAQALSLAQTQTVTTNTQTVLDIKARSLCVHGDSAGAAQTALKARKALEKANITIRPFIKEVMT